MTRLSDAFLTKLVELGEQSKPAYAKIIGGGQRTTPAEDKLAESWLDMLAPHAVIELVERLRAAEGLQQVGYFAGYPVFCRASDPETRLPEDVHFVKLNLEHPLEGYLTTPARAAELKAKGMILGSPGAAIRAGFTRSPCDRLLDAMRDSADDPGTKIWVEQFRKRAAELEK